MPLNPQTGFGGLEGQPDISTPSASKDTSEMPTSRPQSPASTTNGSVSSALPKMSDPPHNAAKNGLSSVSSPSSLPPSEILTSSKEGNPPFSAANDAAAGSGPSPYGTRSRNRTGASRPNYAEDRDLDMMENYGSSAGKREGDAKKATKQAASANASSQGAAQTTTAAAPRPSNGSSRKPVPTDVSHQNQNTGTNTNSKEASISANSTPAAVASSTSASTPAAASTQQPSRKRKAATASQAATHTGSHAQQSSNGPTSTALQKKMPAILHDGRGYSETNMLTFENCNAKPNKDGKLVADDGTILGVNDHVYMVCEPPGEPYYLGRIMEFLHPKSDPSLPVDALRVNWFYRPKDIGRKVQDTRHVFATMHSDISPLTSLRGKIQIKHKAEIPNLAEYKRQPDSFWFEKLYDRYIQKNYEVIPTSQVINVPARVKRVLDERWKYILVEQGRGKEYTSAVKLCKRCTNYCASNNSVDCAVCGRTYHMACVRPPLAKKPSRGFGWSCAACSRAQERKLEARNTPNVTDVGVEEEEEFLDDDEDDLLDTCRNTPDEEDHPPATAEQIYQCSLWPYRYLGMHCKVEDALDYDDRIFPRASTRLGPRHQANVVPWYGRPVVYEKPQEFVKKTGRKNDKANREILAAMEVERLRKEKRPKWIQDTPPGYIERGGDYNADDPEATSTLLWKPPKDMGIDMPDAVLDEYMDKAKSMAKALDLPPRSTNLHDVARDILFKNKFDTNKSLEELPKLDKAVFKEPVLTPAELKKFEEGVSKFGSELQLVTRHVKTAKPATITRFYYTWKKTDKGKQIWGQYANRRGKKDAKKAQDAAKKMADDVADDVDDSAFDDAKAVRMKKGFICKFCTTKNSRQWRRAPANVGMTAESGGRKADKDKNNQYIQALCRRCAELWRRYAIQWEDLDEVAKKVAQTGGKSWRKKVDEELYKELIAADEMMKNTRYLTPPPAATPPASVSGQEPPRKKLKSSALATPTTGTTATATSTTNKTEKEVDPASDTSHTAQTKKKEKILEKPGPPPPPPAPVIPKAKLLPCAVCLQVEPSTPNFYVTCKECRLSVHRACYGVNDQRASGKWTCDTCANDKSPQVAMDYKCVLCPVRHTEYDFVELPKVSHKKKTEKEKEREKAERDAAFKAAEYYRKRQEDTGRPVNPREALKRTADNNWVHATCAVFTPEVKFGSTKALSPAESIPLVPRSRYADTCKVCKTSGEGACVSCQQCKAPVHVECAHQAGYMLGFDVTPVKGYRRDQHNTVMINDEAHTITAGAWCKEHLPSKSSTVHRIHELVDNDSTGLNALQLYVQNFKQADLTLSGCTRKANQISQAAKAFTTVPQSTLNRRASTITVTSGERGERGDNSPPASRGGTKLCITCGTDVSCRWYPVSDEQERALTNGYHDTLGSESRKFVDQRRNQCHKCKKENRQPQVHVPREPTPEPEPMQVDPEPAADATPPPALEPEHAAPGRDRDAFSWSPQPAAGVAPVAIPGAPPMHGQLQAPAIASMAAPMISPGHGPPPPMVAPQFGPPHGGPPMSQHYPYGPPPPHQPNPYGDWPPHHQSPPQHGPPYGHHGVPMGYSHRDMNGGPPPPPHHLQNGGPPPHLAPPNHLRPPPMSASAYPPPPPPAHGPPPPHMAKPAPYMNGYPPPHPPSPRRMSAGIPPHNGGGLPYMPSYAMSHGPPPPPEHYRNGANGPPPPQPPPQQQQQQQQQQYREQPQPPLPQQQQQYREQHSLYPPLPSQQGTPEFSHARAHREHSLPAAHPGSQGRENRQASGASASPSLQNLLS